MRWFRTKRAKFGACGGQSATPPQFLGGPNHFGAFYYNLGRLYLVILGHFVAFLVVSLWPFQVGCARSFWAISLHIEVSLFGHFRVSVPGYFEAFLLILVFF